MPSKQPESQREIALNGLSVPYTLRRSRRRTIGLAIDHRGLRVGAPTLARVSEIEALLRHHGQWVLDKLADWQRRAHPAGFELRDGMQLPWLGQFIEVRLAASSSTRSRVLWESDPETGTARLLTLFAASESDPRQLLQRALRARAGVVLAERLAHMCQKHDIALPVLGLSSARTRWGSCSARGTIRLNWRLAFMPLPVIDYVVAHELAHLQEMNHSPRFWTEVERLFPEWRMRRAELRKCSREIPIF